MSKLIQFRIALFEFLTFPAHLWMRVAAFLVGMQWQVTREIKMEHDYEDDDPPWCGG